MVEFHKVLELGPRKTTSSLSLWGHTVPWGSLPPMLSFSLAPLPGPLSLLASLAPCPQMATLTPELPGSGHTVPP